MFLHVLLPLVFVIGIIISGRRNSSTCILSLTLVSLLDVSVPSFKFISSPSPSEVGLASGFTRYQTVVELNKK